MTGLGVATGRRLIEQFKVDGRAVLEQFYGVEREVDPTRHPTLEIIGVGAHADGQSFERNVYEGARAPNYLAPRRWLVRPNLRGEISDVFRRAPNRCLAGRLLRTWPPGRLSARVPRPVRASRKEGP